MFSSVKWRFVFIYLLLVFLVMSIIGFFIIEKIEMQQINIVLDNMDKEVDILLETSNYLNKRNWLNNSKNIQEELNKMRLGLSEDIYIISNEKCPMIISSTKNSEYLKNALSHKELDAVLIDKAIKGKSINKKIKNLNKNTYYIHSTYPIYENDKILGIIYIKNNLNDAYKTVDESKIILTNATMIALVVTSFLSYVIANNITVPIRELTEKAECMADGNFDIKVNVKSNDEIGRLGSMFNYLILELNNKIKDIEYERSKLETIFMNMEEGVVTLNRSNEIMHINYLGKKILGVGKNIENMESNTILEDFNLDNIDNKDKELLKGKKTISIGDNTYNMKYAPFKDVKGEIGGLIIVFQDITKEMELDKMRKEFVANVSHELKTPITTIKSYNETLMNLLGNKDRDNMNYNFLKIIDSETNRMDRLVSDLLQLSNLDYKKTKWRKELVNLNFMINDILNKLKLSIKDKNHNIYLKLDDNIEKIYVDKDAMEQVFLNVLSNSIKYTEESGDIFITTLNKGNKIEITIKDNGYGIPEEDLDRIFERFYRVEKGRSRELGGTGLGLSIAKEIILFHKGEIKIRSKELEYTEVTIILPMKQENNI